MILERLRFKGLSTAFAHSDVSIDFAALGPGLISLVGANSAGKTTCLELSATATLYRRFAAYGRNFADFVAPDVRDAFSELAFSLGGNRWTVRTQADPQFGGGKGKTEAYVTRNGVSIAGPGLREVDQCLALILPPLDVFLVSVFACQPGLARGVSRSFFALDKATRKALFATLLGLEHLQRQAEVARGRAQRMLTLLERLRQDVGPLEQRVARAQELATANDAATTTVAAAHVTATTAAIEAAAARTRHGGTTEELRRAEQEAIQVAADRTRLMAVRTAAELRVETLTDTLARLAALLGEADAIRAAAAEVPQLDAALEDTGAWGDAFRAMLEPLTVRVAELGAERTQLLATAGRLREAKEAARSAQARVTERQALETEAVAQRAVTAAATEELRTADAALPDLEVAAESERVQRDTRRALEQRVGDLTPRCALLDEIPGVPACAACPLTADARKAAETLATLTAELAALPPAVVGAPAADTLRFHRASRLTIVARRDLSDRWLTAHADELATLASDQFAGANAADVAAELARTIEQGRSVRAALDDATAVHRAMTTGVDAAKAETDALRMRRRECAQKASRAAGIAVAEAQQAETMEAASVAQRVLETAAGALEALPVIDTVPLQAAVEAADQASIAAEAHCTDAEAQLQTCKEELARLDGERRALGDPAAELAALRVRETTLVRDAADWGLLERSLGPDGIQALEIDAAGPTVTALANDLLSTCYGNRFALAIETTVPKKTGGGNKEVFDVRVLDSERGRGDAQGNCGGETVILDEALRLALALFNAARSGFACQTLWRDEVTGALDPENAQRYMAMLRRAMTIGQFHQVLLIAHQQEVWEQADRQLFVGGGNVHLTVRELNAALEAVAEAA